MRACLFSIIRTTTENNAANSDWEGARNAKQQRFVETVMVNRLSVHLRIRNLNLIVAPKQTFSVFMMWTSSRKWSYPIYNEICSEASKRVSWLWYRWFILVTSLTSHTHTTSNHKIKKMWIIMKNFSESNIQLGLCELNGSGLGAKMIHQSHIGDNSL